MTLAIGIAIAIAFVAWINCGFTATAWWACRRLEGRMKRTGPPARWPSIWVLRPCEGDEPGLVENLTSTMLPYPGRRRITFLVPSPEDPSFAAATTAAAGHPEAEVVVTHITSTLNRKSAQLAVGLERVVAGPAEERPELLIQVDSDVRLRGDSLAALVAAIGDRQEVAAAFAVPIEIEVATAADFATAGMLSATLHDFHVLAALSTLTGGVPSLAGPLAGHRLEALLATGGFATLEHLLGEDYEVGRRLHARQLEVAVAAVPAYIDDRGRTMRATRTRTARWIMVVRSQRPGLILTYPTLIAPLPWLLPAGILLVVAGGPAWPLPFLGLLLALRLGLALHLRRWHHAPVGVLHGLGLLLAGESLILAGSLEAMVRRTVRWRGRRLRIGNGGRIEHGEPPPSPPGAPATGRSRS